MRQPTPESVAIGERFKQERLRLGLSPRAVCAIAEVPLSNLLNWETGVGAPDAIALAALDELGGDAVYIITGRSAAAWTSPAKVFAECLALPAPGNFSPHSSRADVPAKTTAFPALAASAGSTARQAFARLDPADRQRLLLDLLAAELGA